jgi:hypothetical protein
LRPRALPLSAKVVTYTQTREWISNEKNIQSKHFAKSHELIHIIPIILSVLHFPFSLCSVMLYKKRKKREKKDKQKKKKKEEKNWLNKSRLREHWQICRPGLCLGFSPGVRRGHQGRCHLNTARGKRYLYVDTSGSSARILIKDAEYLASKGIVPKA